MAAISTLDRGSVLLASIIAGLSKPPAAEKEADIADNYGRLYLIEDADMRQRLQVKYESALELMRNLWTSTMSS